MINRGVPPNGDDWPGGVLDALQVWEQGDLVAQPPFFYFADPRYPVWDATRDYSDTSSEPEVILPAVDVCPPYGMVTTQTCDIAEEDSPRPLRPWVQLAPVYAVTDWKRRKLERSSPRYWMLVPDLAGDHPYVADLRIEVPVEKGWLAQQQRVVGFTDEEKKRKVGETLGLLRGRPAFARELNPLHAAIWSLLAASGDEGDDVAETLATSVEEVGLLLDSHLHPTTAQVVFLTSSALDAESHNRLAAWREELSSDMSDSGITLHAHDVRNMDDVTAADYRRMTVVWWK